MEQVIRFNLRLSLCGLFLAGWLNCQRSVEGRSFQRLLSLPALVRKKSEPSFIEVVKQMISEAGVAISDCANRHVLLRLFLDFVRIDLWQTLIKGSWNKVTGALMNLGKFGALVKKVGAAATEIFSVVRSGNLRSICAIILRFIVGAALFGLGFATGNAVPDLDLIMKNGIGSHRLIWSHSVLPILLAEVLKLFVLRIGKVFYKHLPERRHPLWDKLASGSSKAINLFIGGFQAGVAAHLLKDAFWDGSQNLRGFDGSSIFSKKHLITKEANFLYSREVTPADLFLFGNAVGTGSVAAGRYA